MKKILLDTNAVVWILKGSKKSFGANALRLLETQDVVFVSPVTVFEVQLKRMINKIEITNNLVEGIRSAGLTELPLNISDADAVTKFADLTRHDPFDRLLLAQALTNQLNFLTSDKTLIEFGLDFVVNSRK
jgi:PIN domain nuclease of toxin-antitoxin system